jgi:hypothetical protein
MHQATVEDIYMQLAEYSYMAEQPDFSARCEAIKGPKAAQ